jgi:hypothetical protein
VTYTRVGSVTLRGAVSSVRRQPAVILTEKETVVFAGYLVVTLVASAFTGLAGIASLIGHEYPRSQADMLRVPRSWMLPLYFTDAFGAHLRVHDRHFGPWAMYFSLAAAALP